MVFNLFLKMKLQICVSYVRRCVLYRYTVVYTQLDLNYVFLPLENFTGYGRTVLPKACGSSKSRAVNSDRNALKRENVAHLAALYYALRRRSNVVVSKRSKSVMCVYVIAITSALAVCAQYRDTKRYLRGSVTVRVGSGLSLLIPQVTVTPSGNWFFLSLVTTNGNSRYPIVTYCGVRRVFTLDLSSLGRMHDKHCGLRTLFSPSSSELSLSLSG